MQGDKPKSDRKRGLRVQGNIVLDRLQKKCRRATEQCKGGMERTEQHDEQRTNETKLKCADPLALVNDLNTFYAHLT